LLYLCFVIGIGCVSVLVIVLDWGFPDMHCRRSPWLRRGPHLASQSSRSLQPRRSRCAFQTWAIATWTTRSQWLSAAAALGPLQRIVRS
jgi:hypothetical protein